MSDIVWSIDARFDTMEELTLRMKDYIYKLKCESEIPIEFHISESAETRKVTQAVRQNLFLLFKEGVTNAIKHGDGKSIVATLLLKEKHIILQITNSCASEEPMQKPKIQGGNGLPHMTRRVHNMNGQISIEHLTGHHVITITI